MILFEIAVPTLVLVWFLLIAVLWVGFFFLEGFDFGVGMLLPIIGRNEKKRRVLINSIGPVWDGNEVWLITAGGAMFAAFPGWYASLFSALYLPLLLVLIGLILRGVSFEYRGLRQSKQWRTMIDTFIIVGSLLPSLVFGIGFANFVIGLSNDGLLFDGSFWGLFSPFALLGGVLFILLFLTHGSTFVTLKTRGEIHDLARGFVAKVGWAAVVAMAVFVICQNVFWPAVSEFGDFGVLGWALAVVAIAALMISVVITTVLKREGWGFLFGGISVVALITGIFLRMYGNLGFAQDESVAVGDRLNMITAASSETTLTIMTWAAVIFVPIVLAYQAWTYWVFRKRLSTKNIPDDVEQVA